MNGGNPYNEFLLITQGKTANGFITGADESADAVETYNASGTVYNVYYEYSFTTPQGEKIISRGEDVSPESGYLSESNKKLLPVEVEYLPDKPAINRVKNMTNQCHSITEFLIRRGILGTILLILFLSIGYQMVYKAIKNYRTETNKLIVNIQ